MLFYQIESFINLLVNLFVGLCAGNLSSAEAFVYSADGLACFLLLWRHFSWFALAHFLYFSYSLINMKE